MVRKAIVTACAVFVLGLLLVGSLAWAQAAAPDTAKTTTKATTAKTTTSTTTSTSTKKGQTCGGIVPLTCPAGEACRFPINKCDVADLTGICVKVPETCKKGGPKVCGCDGKTYDNLCELLKAGAHEASKGACKKAA